MNEEELNEEINEVTNESNNRNKPKKSSALKYIIIFVIILILIPLIYLGVTKLITNVEKGIEDNSLGNEQIEENTVQDNTAEKEKEKEPKLEYLDVKLTKDEKILYNKEIGKQGFDVALRQIVDFDNNDFPYEVNLLDDINNKYLLTFYQIIDDPTKSKLFVPYDKMSKQDQENNVKIIEYAKVLDLSKDFLTNPLTEEDLQKVNISNTKIEGNKIKTEVGMGIGLPPFVLKAKSLKRSADNTEEILTIDVLTKKVDGKIDYDSLMEVKKEDVLTWDDSLNYAKVEIVLKIVKNDRTFTSFTFLKD